MPFCLVGLGTFIICYKGVVFWFPDVSVNPELYVIMYPYVVPLAGACAFKLQGLVLNNIWLSTKKINRPFISTMISL